MNNYFISVDWGTSNFRLRLIRIPDLTIIEEIKSSQGIKHTFNLWQNSEEEREKFYLDFLFKQIQKLKTSISPDIQIVVSGMASSSIGIKELPYANLPFNLDGKGLIVDTISHSTFPYSITLVSGVRNTADVMRGEEVQIIGLEQNNKQSNEVIYILPGTHSKHIFCRNGKVEDFKTYMTGELFEILKEHSLLKNSIEPGEINPTVISAFRRGVLKAEGSSEFLHNLFSIRALDLFNTQTKQENFYYLSGLLIGSELINLTSIQNSEIYIAASGILKELYQNAAEALGLHFTMIEEREMDISVIKGQWAVVS